MIISPKGASKLIFAKSKQAVNKKVFLNNLRISLIPFINKYHKNGQYLFWPDLASSIYANEVTAFLDANNVNYVPKVRNAPKIPEALPIKDFWAILKRTVYSGYWQATSIPQLRRRIEYCLSKLDPNVEKRYAVETSVRFERIACCRGIINTYLKTILNFLLNAF